MANARPVADRATASGIEDSGSPIAITLNGSDTDGTIASFVLASLPRHGKLYLNSDLTGLVSARDSLAATGDSLTLYFQPDADWNGKARFTFHAVDDDGQSSRKVRADINVTAVNDAPVANNVTVDAKEDGAVATIRLAGTDVDSRITSFTIVDLPSDGTLYRYRNGTGAVAANDVIARNQILYFKPDSDWNGTDTFNFQATDAQGASSGNATVTINTASVNDAPTADEVAVSGNEDPGSPIAITLNGSDIDGTIASFVLATLPRHGDVYLNSDLTGLVSARDILAATGDSLTLYFQPDADWVGKTRFTFHAIDDDGRNSRNVRAEIDVTAVNDAPTPLGVTKNGYEDSTIAVRLKGADVDGRVVSSTIVDLPDNGTLFLHRDGTGAVAAGDVIAAGTNLYFVPDNDWNGTATFHYLVTDNLGAVSTATATAVINVIARDTPAVGLVVDGTTDDDNIRGGTKADTIDGAAGDDAIFAASGDDTIYGGPGDDSVDGGGGFDTFVLATTYDQVDISYDPKEREWTIVGPDGTDTVSRVEAIRFSDGYEIYVNDSRHNPPDAEIPVAADDSFAVTTHGSVSGDLAANDKLLRGFGGELLADYTFASTQGVPVAGPTHGELTINADGTFTYTPTGDIQGSDQFAYTITGPGGATSTAVVTVTITPDSQPEFAADVNFGAVNPAAIDFTFGSDGRPTDVSGFRYQFDRDALIASATGDAGEIVSRLQLLSPSGALLAGGGSHDGPVQLFDSPLGVFGVLQDTSVQVVGDEILVSIDPSYFDSDDDPSGTFSFRFGYENYAGVDSIVGLGDIIPLDEVTANFSDALATFSSDLNIIDDRGNSGGIGGAIINGEAGQDGRLYLMNPPLDLPGEDDGLVLLLFGGLGVVMDPQAALASLESFLQQFAFNFNTPWAEYDSVDGTEGGTGNLMSDSIAGNAGSDVIFGRDGWDAGHGGKGGDATPGGDGLFLTLTVLTTVSVDGPRGADGGEGGDGGAASFSIDGAAGDDTIIGGNGGKAGDGGGDGSDGGEGNDMADPFGGLQLDAQGGPGGSGGLGGHGGATSYSIVGGEGNDTIYGGDGGDGGAGRGGSALYSIDGGDGNDTIYGGHGGDAGVNVGANTSDGSTSYEINGGAGDDVINGGNQGGANRGAPTGASDYLLDGGDGNDVLTIGSPAIPQAFSTYHAGTSINPGFSARFVGNYTVNGGDDDDTIDLSSGLFASLRVDGGAGFDTMIMHRPSKSLFTEYSIDFDADAYGVDSSSTVSTPAIRDMIVGIEHLIFDSRTLGFDVTMSGDSIKAMTSPVTDYQAPSGDIVASTSLMFVDGSSDATLTLSDAGDWAASGQQLTNGEIYDVFYNASDNVFLLTHGFDSILV